MNLLKVTQTFATEDQALNYLIKQRVLLALQPPHDAALDVPNPFG